MANLDPKVREQLQNAKKLSDVSIEFLEAAAKGDRNTTLRLLKSGQVDVNEQDGAGKTPLLVAALGGHCKLLTDLLENGADVHHQDGNESTALFYACKSGNLEAAEILLAKGARVDLCTHKKLTVLHHAAASGNSPLLEKLLSAGASKLVNAGEGAELGTALHWAAREGKLECVHLLLRAGANVLARDQSQLIPLHMAAVAGQTACVQALLGMKKEGEKPSSDVSSQVNAVIEGGGGGATALHLAAEFGHTATLEVLLAAGAKLYKDNEGDTAVTLARRQGHRDAIRVFKKYGCVGQAEKEAMYADGKKRLADAYKNKGNEHFYAHRYKEAIAMYDRAVETDRANHVFYSNRSAAYYHLGNYQEAYDDAERSTVLKPSWAKGFHRRGMAAIKLHDFEDAETCFRRGMKADSSYLANRTALDELLALRKEKEASPSKADPDKK